MSICGACNTKPIQATGAGQMVAQVQKGRAYAFCDRRGTRVFAFPFIFAGSKAFQINIPLTFGPDARIQGKTIKSIEIVSTAAMATNGGIDNTGAVAYGYLTIVEKCGPKQNIVSQIPLTALDRSTNGGKLFFCNFNTADFKNCYLSFTSGSLSTSNGMFFNFNVE